jgi:3-dehydroquinate dehydratase-2
MISDAGKPIELEIDSLQTNHEGEIIDAIHQRTADAILINPAPSPTPLMPSPRPSSVETPAVEVHISNIRERESWRARTVTGEACVLTIYGRGRRVRGWAEASGQPCFAPSIYPLRPHPANGRRAGTGCP